MSKAYIFPAEVHGRLVHDTAGWTVESVPDTHPDNSAACQSFDIPAGTPNRNGATLTLTQPGLAFPVQHGILINEWSRWMLEIDIFHGVPDPQQSGPESGQIRASGTTFIDDQNRPWFMRAAHVHVMPSKIYNGEDVGPIMDAVKAYGCNTLAPICTHLSQWKIDHGYYLNPLADLGRWQGTLGVMFDMAVARGLRVAPMCLADCQAVSPADQQRIWHAYCEVVKGRWNLFAVKWNEDLANGGNADHDTDLPDLGGVLACKGDRGTGEPPHQASWDWLMWEARRWPNVKWCKVYDDSGAGLYELLEGYQGANGPVGPFQQPLVHFEPIVFNDTPTDAAGDTNRITDPSIAHTLGRLAAAGPCAGIGFLGAEWMECRPLGPITAESCRQMNRGAKASFLR